MTPRAPYACRPEASRGRRHAEPESATRTAFQRDRDRILHSTAFRRLEYKTQVFVNHEGDHYRTRLTHSLEVAQIARSISRVLGLDEDLAEALALAHDLGHPPFGHAGEDALDAAMKPFGGFDHNAQTLAILTSLEHRYADFDGLNLAWETLEGAVKHNGPLVGPLADPRKAGSLPWRIAEYVGAHDLELSTFASAEAQVAAAADDIAYNNHDLDDGLRAGLFAVEDVEGLSLLRPALAEVRARYPRIERGRLIHETVRRLIDAMIRDLIEETGRRVARIKPRSAADVRQAGEALIGFSAAMRAADAELKGFLFKNMYRHYKVNRMASKAKRVVGELFSLYLAEPECLPTEWRGNCDGPGTERTARIACDFVAGMTDRYAFEEHDRLFNIHTRS
jgi:dGTPase